MDRTKERHALFSPSKFDLYSPSYFPGVEDLLHGIDELQGSQLEDRRKELRRHLSDLMIVIRGAASYLDEPYLI